MNDIFFVSFILLPYFFFPDSIFFSNVFCIYNYTKLKKCDKILTEGYVKWNGMFSKLLPSCESMDTLVKKALIKLCS